MKFDVDWRYLRPALIVASLSLLFSGMLGFLGYRYHAEMASHHAIKSDEFSEAERRLEELWQDKDIIASYLNSFNAMEKAGLFDSSHRVDWVDTVNEARRRMKLPVVRYQVSPQQPYTADYILDDGLVNVMSSRIELEAGLLHEGDLVDLFDWMDTYAPGQIHFANCEMRRVELVFAYYTHGPNLNLTCEFDWFSIIPADQG